ncbi:pro-sigmaK processing inhibitor BofA family protein [Carboxydothermus pertinax]|uniref:Sigma-K processing regulatory protein BofA n=1 Tax=Carboxydothermus pertinax TaxID=870242 RepID=A0A1L8CT99_9THEO|nr:pro-sigmaK processing inhibitor BofA family protein [Carboxydothermus pertinax]GAV22127.1 sigma-K processing regulatory protein BofA [Carboxydothermus pertinax]
MRLLGMVFRKIFFWMVLGFIFLGIFNLIGKKFSWHLAVNPVTVFIAGILDLPGILLLAALRYIAFVL